MRVKLLLLGASLGHSRSPRIHRAALDACGLSGEYLAREVDAAGFSAACAEITAETVDGANVTMPYKRAAHLACDRLDDEAARAGAVNTLARRHGGLAGWNTDVAALRSALGALPGGAVVVLGSGGAAAAALVAASGRSVVVSARRLAAARDLAGRIDPGCGTVPWGTAVPEAVVVNATPLGMRHESLPAGVVEVAAGLIDLAYGDAETPAVAAARSLGIPAIDGVSVLIGQAAASFEIWTGLVAPLQAMEAAARRPETLKAP